MNKLLSIVMSFIMAIFSHPTGTQNTNNNIDTETTTSSVETVKSEPLKIKNLWNLRDLGGFKGTDQKTTKTHSFLRSSIIIGLDENEIQQIKDYGVKTVIDLRCGCNVYSMPNSLSDVDGINYHHIPLYFSNYNSKSLIYDPYVKILEKQKSSIKKVFKTISNAEKGSVIFHCNGGKDRTAIIAMILLGLVGVSDDDITKDYMKTYENLEKLISEKNINIGPEEKKQLSQKDVLETEFKNVIKHIKENYKSFQEYLLDCGLSQKQIDSIKERFI
ncbi:MAG: tyrosine-protein phosphatase [Clostridia bacterium]|nr:tyrosine-protein phosphatase [Clostridia bacterium]